MRIDYVIYWKSNLSAPKGYLEINQNGETVFTKYKSQASGRTNIFFWLIYQLIMLFKKDKVLVTIKNKEIKDVKLVYGSKGFVGIGSKYTEILVETEGKTYKFLSEPNYDPEKIESLVNIIKNGR